MIIGKVTLRWHGWLGACWGPSHEDGGWIFDLGPASVAWRGGKS